MLIGREERELAKQVGRVIRLLERIEAEREGSDVVWRGPYFIPRRGDWWPTRFLRYQDHLFCTVEMGWSSATLSWNATTGRISFEGGTPVDSTYQNDPVLWHAVFEQVVGRSRSTISRPAGPRQFARSCGTPLQCSVRSGAVSLVAHRSRCGAV